MYLISDPLISLIIIALIPVTIGIILYFYGYFREREEKDKILEDRIKQLEKKLEEKEWFVFSPVNFS